MYITKSIAFILWTCFLLYFKKKKGDSNSGMNSFNIIKAVLPYSFDIYMNQSIRVKRIDYFFKINNCLKPFFNWYVKHLLTCRNYRILMPLHQFGCINNALLHCYTLVLFLDFAARFVKPLLPALTIWTGRKRSRNNLAEAEQTSVTADKTSTETDIIRNHLCKVEQDWRRFFKMAHRRRRQVSSWNSLISTSCFIF